MPLPKINIDNFNRDDMYAALKDYGTYELVGPSIDKLMVLAKEAHAVAKQILSLPLETLQQHSAKDFNGFEDVRGKTLNTKTLRNQIAFHFKPYLDRKIPDNIDITPLEKFYQAEHELLVKHYNQYQDAFIPKDQHIKVADSQHDKKSVLMMRRYFKNTQQNPSANNDQTTTGIPAHSDHGRLTFVISDQPGLEVFHNGKWIPASAQPGITQCIVNFGDWSLFRCQENKKAPTLEEMESNKHSIDESERKSQKYPFEAGLHRVPEVKEDRVSMSLSLNPPVNETVYNLFNKVVTFEKFLQSPKNLHRDTTRDISATDMANEQDALRPKVQLTVPKNTPTLHVLEKTNPLQQNWLMVKGSGAVLSNTVVIGDPKKSSQGYSYAYPSIEAARNSNLPNDCDEDPRSFAIQLNNAADVYVVEESAFYANQSLDDVAKTCVPLQDYQNQFKEPVYLIQRGLLIDEAVPTYEEQNTLSYRR